MDEYPDADEEYDLMYADEMELLREREQIDGNLVQKKAVQAKRSLDFSSPVLNKTTQRESPNTESHEIQLTCNSTVNKNNVPIPINSSQPQEICLTSLEPVDNDFSSINGSNKRTIEEIFGDIDDIEFNDVDLPSKRQKTEEEIDNELISRILEEKRFRQLVMEPAVQQVQGRSNYEAKENLSLNIPRWAFVPLTNSDGDRIYVRLQSEESWDNQLDSAGATASLHTSYASVWEEARKILDKKLEEQNQRSEMEMLPDVDTEMEIDSSLWVERYKPNSYIDLLSEESINRAVLHWLHLWDKIVFKKEVKTKEPQQRNSFSKRTGQFQLSNKWRGKKEGEPELDEDGRPHHKVVLLCGPPGVGKTTLAHLLARLAGYRPVELNASDERSVEAFSNALKSATLMRSVLDAERRPNCLILDEIDGAPLPTVELLVKWCTASSSTTSDGRRKTKCQPLRRPVIAICNDLYASSLRPLRVVSLIVHVGGVSSSRLSSRLSVVCGHEGLSARPHVLTALAARARGDVRAALSVLHFIKARAKSQVEMEDVMSGSVGEKDCHKGLMQALQAVFTTNTEEDPFTAVLKVISAAGEYDRLAEGIFELYITSRVDGRLHTVCTTLDWLVHYDHLHSWTMSNQNYSLYGMLPYCLAGCYGALAARNANRVRFPMQAQEVYRKWCEVRGILEAVWRGASPTVAPSMRRALQLDVLSLLPYILAPTLRSANVQLCSESERAALSSAAAALCDYGLQYVQQRGPDGGYGFVLEPDIYRLAFFGTEERVKPPPAVRQAISREQGLEQIRRLEEQISKVTIKNKRSDSCAVNNAKSDPKTCLDREQRLPNHLQRLQPKQIEKTAPQVHRDFFGRLVPIAETTQRSDAARDLLSSSTVFYQYREGFNNAVRRSVRMRDML